MLIEGRWAEVESPVNDYVSRMNACVAVKRSAPNR